MSAHPLITDDLIVRDIDCEPGDVVYVKSIATAYDGLCCLFSDGDGKVQLVAPKGREAELELLVNDLLGELSVESTEHNEGTNPIRDPLRRC
jgi:hypothetical protein